MEQIIIFASPWPVASFTKRVRREHQSSSSSRAQLVELQEMVTRRHTHKRQDKLVQ